MFSILCWFLSCPKSVIITTLSHFQFSLSTKNYPDFSLNRKNIFSRCVPWPWLYWINRCNLKLLSNNIYHTKNLRSPETRLKEEEEEERLHLQLRWQKVFEHFPLNSFDLSEYPFKYFSNFILKSRVFLLGRPAQWHVTTARTYWPDLRKFRYVYSWLKLYFCHR